MTDRSLVQRLTYYALQTGSSFALKVAARGHVAATFTPRAQEAFVVSDVNVDAVLRTLLRRVETALGVSPATMTPLTPPSDLSVYIARLTPAQHDELRALLDRYKAFKTRVLAEWEAGDVEPTLASPRSSLQPCPEMNQCGAED